MPNEIYSGLRKAGSHRLKVKGENQLRHKQQRNGQKEFILAYS